MGKSPQLSAGQAYNLKGHSKSLSVPVQTVNAYPRVRICAAQAANAPGACFARKTKKREFSPFYLCPFDSFVILILFFNLIPTEITIDLADGLIQEAFDIRRIQEAFDIR